MHLRSVSDDIVYFFHASNNPYLIMVQNLFKSPGTDKNKFTAVFNSLKLFIICYRNKRR